MAETFSIYLNLSSDSKVKMEQFWRLAVSAAGFGAVATFAMLSLYKGWLKLPVFQTATKKQQFTLLKLFLVLPFLFALAGLIAYVVTERRAAEAETPREI